MYSTGRTNRSPEITIGIILTVVIHALPIAIYSNEERFGCGGVATADEESDALLPVVSMELLRWGEVMPDENELPWISNPAPEERPEDVVVIEDDTDTVAVEEETDRDDPVEDEQDDDEDVPEDSDRHNPHRPTNDDPEIGSPDGWRGGTSLSESAISNFLSEIQSQIQRHYRAPSSLSSDQLEELEASIHIELDETGRIIHYRIRRSSGSDAFDSSAEAAVNHFSRGSARLRLPPNEEFREMILEHGILITLGANQ